MPPLFVVVFRPSDRVSRLLLTGCPGRVYKSISLFVILYFIVPTGMKQREVGYGYKPSGSKFIALPPTCAPCLS